MNPGGRPFPVAALLLTVLNPQLSTGFTQGTAFTYQGRLNNGANPVSGTYDLQFSIYALCNWNYKSQDAAIRHLGPLALDFKAAFGLGESDKGITTIDADGVALAAIQGLNEKVEVSSQNSET